MKRPLAVRAAEGLPLSGSPYGGQGCDPFGVGSGLGCILGCRFAQPQDKGWHAFSVPKGHLSLRSRERSVSGANRVRVQCLPLLGVEGGPGGAGWGGFKTREPRLLFLLRMNVPPPEEGDSAPAKVCFKLLHLPRSGRGRWQPQADGGGYSGPCGATSSVP